MTATNAALSQGKKKLQECQVGPQVTAAIMIGAISLAVMLIHSKILATEPATNCQMMTLPHSQSSQLCQNVHGFLGHCLESQTQHNANLAGNSPTMQGLPWPLHWDAQIDFSPQPLPVGRTGTGGKNALAWPPQLHEKGGLTETPNLTGDQTASLTRNRPGPWFAQPCLEVILAPAVPSLAQSQGK